MREARIRLLGGFAALVDGGAVPDTAWRLRKARELVKLLALAVGHRLHREQATDALWPDRDPGSAVNNLHQAVHVARRVLGAQAIESRDESLRLVATVDVDDFEQAAATARRVATPAAYRAALDLCAGELLAENPYDDWAAEPREALLGVRATLEDRLRACRGCDGPLPYRVPAETSSFVRRAHERGELRALLAHERGELRALLAHARLVTLAGPGGAGKTRLARELARAVAPSWAAGVALAELGAVADPGLVPAAVATSREPLRVPGEVVFRVPSRRASTTASGCCAAAAAPRPRRSRRSARRSTGATGCSTPRGASCCAGSPSSPGASSSRRRKRSAAGTGSTVPTPRTCWGGWSRSRSWPSTTALGGGPAHGR